MVEKYSLMVVVLVFFSSNSVVYLSVRVWSFDCYGASLAGSCVGRGFIVC